MQGIYKASLSASQHIMQPLLFYFVDTLTTYEFLLHIYVEVLPILKIDLSLIKNLSDSFPSILSLNQELKNKKKIKVPISRVHIFNDKFIIIVLNSRVYIAKMMVIWH